jgi:protein-S-isoprenylcysteine O-methyltransferase Ste14
MKDWRGATLFGVQALCLAYILLTGYWFASPAWIGLELAGVALGAWAISIMKPRHLSPLPRPHHNARLVMRGPYRWIRHPMYTAVLLTTGALVVDQPKPTRLAVWLVLLADLLLKLRYEEALLARRFPEYAAYRKRTKQLIPFVY